MFRSRLSFNGQLQLVCKECKLLEVQCLVRKASLVRLPKTNPSLLHKTFEKMETCAKKGCLTCRIFLKGLLRECYSLEQEEALHKAADVNIIFPSIEGLSSRAGTGISFVVEAKVSKSQSVQTTIELAVSNELVSVAKSANDPIVFQKARQWLRKCCNEHYGCTQEMNIGDPPYNPTRLLDLGPHDSSLVRLINSPPNLVPYCALSYCWGQKGDQFLRTTQANIREHEQGIPHQQFSGTLLDFITVSRKLNVRYVWIDALCIIQEDPDDFARESVLMHKVYNHALLTVSVCSSRDATERFLKPRKAESLQLEHVVFAGSRLSLEAKTLEEIRSRSPLMERAWTFQEEILSPRTLYWTNHGVFWNCVREQYAEHDAGTALPPRNRDFDWNRTIETYSARLLGHRKDRLTALAGVAAKFAKEKQGDEYVAGLWKSTLPHSLLWTVDGIPRHPRPSGEPKEEHEADPQFSGEYVAPSWSWASLAAGQAIKAYPFKHGSSNGQIKGHQVTLTDDTRGDPLGPILHATISMEGHIRPLLYPNSELITWPLSGEENGEITYPSLWWPERNKHSARKDKAEMMTSPGKSRWVIVKLDRSLEFPPEDVECLQIGDGFLALTKVNSSQNRTTTMESNSEVVYRRIGAGFISQCPDFFKDSELRSVILV